MVHKTLIPLTHTPLVNHNDMSLPKIICGKDLSEGLQRSKESNHQRSLCPPNTLPRERRLINTNQDTIVRSNIE
jgi:hypothetical protein